MLLKDARQRLLHGSPGLEERFRVEGSGFRVYSLGLRARVALKRGASRDRRAHKNDFAIAQGLLDKAIPERP